MAPFRAPSEPRSALVLRPRTRGTDLAIELVKRQRIGHLLTLDSSLLTMSLAMDSRGSNWNALKVASSTGPKYCVPNNLSADHPAHLPTGCLAVAEIMVVDRARHALEAVVRARIDSETSYREHGRFPHGMTTDGEPTTDRDDLDGRHLCSPWLVMGLF